MESATLPQAPAGCRITKLAIEADTEEAFVAALESLKITQKPLTVGPITSGPTTAYSFRFVHLTLDGGLKLEIQGPHRQHKITLEDA